MYLTLFGASYREGRAAITPKRKDDKRLIADYTYWEVEDNTKDNVYNGEQNRHLTDGLDHEHDAADNWEP